MSKRQPQPRQRPQAPSMAHHEARMFSRTYQATAGWSRPIPGAHWHYFTADAALSACGKWLFSGAPREDGNDERAETCEQCATQVQQMRRRRGGQIA